MARGRLRCTYRHESVTTLVKVQNTKDHARLASLVTLGPRLAQQLPLWIELAANLAGISRIESCQQDSNSVVPRQSGDFLVEGIIELDRVAGEDIRLVFLVAIDGVCLFGSQDTCTQKGEREENGGPAHGEDQVDKLKGMNGN